MGSVVDGSGSVVRLFVGPVSVVVTGGSIGAITMAVVVVTSDVGWRRQHCRGVARRRALGDRGRASDERGRRRDGSFESAEPRGTRRCAEDGRAANAE